MALRGVLATVGTVALLCVGTCLVAGVGCLVTQSLDGISDGQETGPGPEPCPGDAGPTMVRVGSFCIDSTEVTVAHYAAFVDAYPSLDAQPPACSFNTSLAPVWPEDAGVPAPDMPVRYIDWCDAYAYCLWAGACRSRGGAYSTYAHKMNCAYSDPHPRSETPKNAGVRCCSP